VSAPARRLRVLFLCTGNSARSILAEHFLRRFDAVHFDAYSAGAAPSGAVHPLALEMLRDVYRIDPKAARSKSWEEYRDERFDFVITLCDKARESCPVWPGQPILAHWGSEDPDAASGTEAEKRRVFRRVAQEIYRRVELLCALPIEKLDRLRLEEMTRAIGRNRVDAPTRAAAASATS
jgi:arsenate reductase (thioredoxin)